MNAGQAITDAMRQQKAVDLIRLAWDDRATNFDRFWYRRLSYMTILNLRKVVINVE